MEDNTGTGPDVFLRRAREIHTPLKVIYMKKRNYWKKNKESLPLEFVKLVESMKSAVLHAK
eukprot:15366681-Ditylum_brightwellii.AAC.3